MAKRLKVGSVVKSKEKGKPDYIQMTGKQAQLLAKHLSQFEDNDKVFINLESKESQIASLEAAMESGKLDAEYAKKQIGFAENIPDFVRFELIVLEK